MLRLKKRIENSNSADNNAANSIKQYIQENIIPHVSNDEGQSPSMLVYLARRIVERELDYDHIPDLLDILANLEASRRLAAHFAREALQRQRLAVESRNPGTRILGRAEEKSLKRLANVERNNDISTVLRGEIMLELCRLHVCHLWTSPEFYLILKFMKRYFPANYVEEGDPFADEHWQSVLHHGSTKAERERMFIFGSEMKELLKDAHAWDLERQMYFERFGHSEEEIFGESEFMSYSRDFNAKFGIGMAEKRTLEALKVYLDEAQRATNLIEKLFPSTQHQSERAAAVLLAQGVGTQTDEASDRNF